MAKLSTLNIEEIFRQDAQKLIDARERSKLIHSTSDIKSAGNEVEEEVRKFLRSRMPSNYYVGHGHVMDYEQKTSPQFDIIISDNTSIPIILRTNDSTEYFPIESVYVIGEVKSSYNKSDKPIEKFCESMKLVKDEMKREIVSNTAFGGELNDGTLIRDTILGKSNAILNAIFSFVLFVNSDDFNIDDFKECQEKYGNMYLPNEIIFLDKGVIFFGKVENNKIIFNRYPDYNNDKENIWIFSPFLENSGNGGNHLGFLYYNILDHLTNSYLEPINLMPYFNRLFIGRRSQMIELKNKT